MQLLDPIKLLFFLTYSFLELFLVFLQLVHSLNHCVKVLGLLSVWGAELFNLLFVLGHKGFNLSLIVELFILSGSNRSSCQRTGSSHRPSMRNGSRPWSLSLCRARCFIIWSIDIFLDSFRYCDGHSTLLGLNFTEQRMGIGRGLKLWTSHSQSILQGWRSLSAWKLHLSWKHGALVLLRVVRLTHNHHLVRILWIGANGNCKVGPKS